MPADRWGKVRLAALIRIAPNYSALAVYVFLCAHADPRGLAWPDLDEVVAELLGMSSSTMRRAKRALVQTCEIEPGDDGRGWLVLSELERARRLSARRGA